MDLPVVVATSKKLSKEEKRYLRSGAACILEKDQTGKLDFIDKLGSAVCDIVNNDSNEHVA